MATMATMRCGSVGGDSNNDDGVDTTSKIKFYTEIIFSANVYISMSMNCIFLKFNMTVCGV